jgi:hypothetical protein
MMEDFPSINTHAGSRKPPARPRRPHRGNGPPRATPTSTRAETPREAIAKLLRGGPILAVELGRLLSQRGHPLGKSRKALRALVKNHTLAIGKHKLPDGTLADIVVPYEVR